MNLRACLWARLTFLGELDAGLSSPVAVLHVAGVVAQVALLQTVDGQRDGDFLLPQVLPDCPAGGGREHRRGDACMLVLVGANETLTLPEGSALSAKERPGLASVNAVMK